MDIKGLRKRQVLSGVAYDGLTLSQLEIRATLVESVIKNSTAAI
jgi:hypothetical protein